MASTRAIWSACSGWRSAANRNSEWIAASRALRVRTLLPRSCSRWVRNAATSVGVEVGDVEPARRLAGALLGEAQQQPQRVAVGGDGARAGLALGQQPVGEERLQGGGEQAHRGSTGGLLEPLGRRREQFRGGGEVPVGGGRVGVAEVGRQERQLRRDVDVGAVPVAQRGHREAVPQPVDSRAGCACRGGDSGAGEQFGEGVVHAAVEQPGAAGGDEEAARARAWAQPLARLGVVAQRGHRRGVQREPAVLAELGLRG